MVTYLLDTSVIVRLNQRPVLQKISTIGSSRCRVPATVMLEVGVTGRSLDDYRRLMQQLRSSFTVVTASAWAQEWALEVQELMAISGQHRSAGVADLLIAATAQQHDATVLHYDRDFDTVAKVTGQPMEWVATPGTLDGQSR